MLRDYEDGRIEGIIYYDLDRMARQPRDLEDQIDLAEFCKRVAHLKYGTEAAQKALKQMAGE